MMTGILGQEFSREIMDTDWKLREAVTLLDGIRGMVTTALLFKLSGWEVRLPDPEDDFNYEADLFVRDRMGRIYAVDVTARESAEARAGNQNIFFAGRKSRPANLKNGEWRNVFGFLRVICPPLRSSESEKYYSDRAIGFPNGTMVAEFKGMLERSK